MLRTYEKHGFQKTYTNPAPDLMNYLMQIQHGKFGTEKQQNFERYCRGRDLSEIAIYYTVECPRKSLIQNT